MKLMGKGCPNIDNLWMQDDSITNDQRPLTKYAKISYAKRYLEKRGIFQFIGEFLRTVPILLNSSINTMTIVEALLYDRLCRLNENSNEIVIMKTPNHCNDCGYTGGKIEKYFKSDIVRCTTDVAESFDFDNGTMNALYYPAIIDIDYSSFYPYIDIINMIDFFTVIATGKNHTLTKENDEYILTTNSTKAKMPMEMKHDSLKVDNKYIIIDKTMMDIKHTIIPFILKELIESRKRNKSEISNSNSSSLKNREMAIKLVANAFIGVIGSKYFQCGYCAVSDAITTIGREIITQTITEFKNECFKRNIRVATICVETDGIDRSNVLIYKPAGLKRGDEIELEDALLTTLGCVNNEKQLSGLSSNFSTIITSDHKYSATLGIDTNSWCFKNGYLRLSDDCKLIGKGTCENIPSSSRFMASMFEVSVKNIIANPIKNSSSLFVDLNYCKQ